MPQVCCRPPYTEEKRNPPVVDIGEVRLVEVPSPSSPLPLYPQQYESPTDVRPHIWEPPSEILVNERPPEAWTGVGLMPATPAPKTLYPQQYAAPELVSAQ